jgi:hypothetical protein
MKAFIVFLPFTQRIMNPTKPIYRTPLNDIYLDENGILCLSPDKNAEIDLAEVKQCFSVYRKMGYGAGQKVLQLIHANENVSMTRDAREFVMTHGADYFIASAIISNNLAVKIVVNFVNSFYRDRTVPFRIFSHSDNARSWLLEFKQLDV